MSAHAGFAHPSRSGHRPAGAAAQAQAGADAGRRRLAPALLFTRSRWRAEAPHLYRPIESAGLVLILVCILGRTWCTLYIGGLKNASSSPPAPTRWSATRSMSSARIGTAGIGAQTGSALLALLFAAGALAVFQVVARHEESVPGRDLSGRVCRLRGACAALLAAAVAMARGRRVARQTAPGAAHVSRGLPVPPGRARRPIRGLAAAVRPVARAPPSAVTGPAGWRLPTPGFIIGPSVRREEPAMIAARLSIAALAGLAALVCPAAVRAQLADRCLAVSQAPRLVQPATYRPAALKPTEVRLTFVGHATWLIESAGAVRIATDYNDYVRPQVVPEIATMNRAHTTHYSNFPDPGIGHVLKGWNPEGSGPARHDLTVVRRARAQRRHQHPRLERRLRAPRQLHLHLRGGGHVHRPSGPPAPHLDRPADRPDRPARRGDGPRRRQLHHGRHRHGRGAEGLARPPDPAHALLQSLHPQPLPGAHRRRFCGRAGNRADDRRLAADACRASPRSWCCRAIQRPAPRQPAAEAAIPAAMLLPGGKRRRREPDAIPPGACARDPLLEPIWQPLAGGARLPADGAGHRHVRGHAHGDPLHHPAPAGRRGRLLPQRVRAGGDPALARAPRAEPVSTPSGSACMCCAPCSTWCRCWRSSSACR